MLGSIVGDIVGSIYEFANIKTKDFEFFQPEMERTDDSILCIATADWLLHGGDVSHYYSRYALEYPYPMGGYGGMFKAWSSKVARQGIPEPIKERVWRYLDETECRTVRSFIQKYNI